MNGKTEVRLRKYRNNLVTGGWAVILFCLWDVAKIISAFFIKSTYSEFFESFMTIEDKPFRVIVIIITLMLAGFILFVHAYVGKCAIQVGQRKRNRTAYIVVAILVFLFTFYSLTSDITGVKNVPIDLTIASFILDTTMLVALADLIIASFAVKHLTKKLKAEGV